MPVTCKSVAAVLLQHIVSLVTAAEIYKISEGWIVEPAGSTCTFHRGFAGSQISLGFKAGRARRVSWFHQIYLAEHAPSPLHQRQQQQHQQQKQQTNQLQPPRRTPMVKEETHALTGHILQTDASASDIMLPAKDSSSSWWRSKHFVLQLATGLLLVALLGTVIGLAVSLTRSNQNRSLDPACIHALGGGPVKSGKPQQHAAAASPAVAEVVPHLFWPASQTD